MAAHTCNFISNAWNFYRHSLTVDQHMGGLFFDAKAVAILNASVMYFAGGVCTRLQARECFPTNWWIHQCAFKVSESHDINAYKKNVSCAPFMAQRDRRDRGQNPLNLHCVMQMILSRCMRRTNWSSELQKAGDNPCTFCWLCVSWKNKSWLSWEEHKKSSKGCDKGLPWRKWLRWWLMKAFCSLMKDKPVDSTF